MPSTTCAGASMWVPECITVVIFWVSTRLGHAVQSLDLDVLEVRPGRHTVPPGVGQVVELQRRLAGLLGHWKVIR